MVKFSDLFSRKPYFLYTDNLMVSSFVYHVLRCVICAIYVWMSSNFQRCLENLYIRIYRCMHRIYLVIDTCIYAKTFTPFLRTKNIAM